MDNKKLNEEAFAEIINDFLEKVEARVLLTMPAGTQEVTIEDDIGGGPVIQFYFLLQAFETVIKDLKEAGGIVEGEGWEKVVDHVLGVLRADLIKGEKDV